MQCHQPSWQKSNLPSKEVQRTHCVWWQNFDTCYHSILPYLCGIWCSQSCSHGSLGLHEDDQDVDQSYSKSPTIIHDFLKCKINIIYTYWSSILLLSKYNKTTIMSNLYQKCSYFCEYLIFAFTAIAIRSPNIQHAEILSVLFAIENH